MCRVYTRWDTNIYLFNIIHIFWNDPRSEDFYPCTVDFTNIQLTSTKTLRLGKIIRGSYKRLSYASIEPTLRRVQWIHGELYHSAIRAVNLWCCFFTFLLFDTRVAGRWRDISRYKNPDLESHLSFFTLIMWWKFIVVWTKLV